MERLAKMSQQLGIQPKKSIPVADIRKQPIEVRLQDWKFFPGAGSPSSLKWLRDRGFDDDTFTQAEDYMAKMWQQARIEAEVRSRMKQEYADA